MMPFPEVHALSRDLAALLADYDNTREENKRLRDLNHRLQTHSLGCDAGNPDVDSDACLIDGKPCYVAALREDNRKLSEEATRLKAERRQSVTRISHLEASLGALTSRGLVPEPERGIPQSVLPLILSDQLTVEYHGQIHRCWRVRSDVRLVTACAMVLHVDRLTAKIPDSHHLPNCERCYA